LKYLIQVQPPGDLIPEAIRTIVIAQNMSSAGILFDDSFGSHPQPLLAIKKEYNRYFQK
jgi:hypothetical protein